MVNYEYDLFLSYSRKTAVADWIKNRFIPLFRDYLANDLGYIPNIFIDTEEIAPGDLWPQRLKNALARSKCLIAMWSPLYFSSEWCCRELAVMHKRNTALGLGTTANPSGIILPVNIRDGISFPAAIKDFQWLDCKRFVRTGESFRNSPLYLEFEEELQEWTPRVAETISLIDHWHDEWLTPEWLDVPCDNFLVQPSALRQPRMA